MNSFISKSYQSFVFNAYSHRLERLLLRPAIPRAHRLALESLGAMKRYRLQQQVPRTTRGKKLLGAR